MLISDIHALLLDMDGTVYLGPDPIAGAKEFIEYLQKADIPFLFLTNNPSADASCYSAKLKSMGIDVTPNHVLTAGAATAAYLMEKTTWRNIYALGTPCFEKELQRAGLALNSKEPEAVVISFDKTLTYEKLERACLLLREGLPYIATNPDKVCPTEYGYIPDCGAIAALLESAADRSPRYIGKPSPDFAQMALLKLNVEGTHTAMVGDRLYTDMEMAQQAGLASILVLSGETEKNDLVTVPQQPDFVFESVVELHAAMAAS
ncbi:MAG: HAD-IIA family hydrolase [Candidatus Hydrogenedentes bacterium]|nr:HAD-IIA family hydrolase [Candidatus Hydrogenedentota bacterium]